MTAPSRISVVVPCFNAARYVVGTLRSVLSQEGVDLEVIVVDDGSTDGSAELIAETFPSVKVLRHSNRGVAAARNLGIRAATHEWIAFVDADDIWLPGKLAAQWALLQSQPQARMAYTAWQVWCSDQPEPPGQYLEELDRVASDAERWKGASGWIYPHLLLDCVVWTSTVLMHRSVLGEVGAFDPALPVGEDYDLWLRASRVTPILRVNRPLALYRMHGESITRQVPERNYKAEVVSRALKRWGYASPEGGQASATDVNRGLARSWSDFAGAQLKAGNVALARSSAVRALRAEPTHLLGWTVLAKALTRSMLTARSRSA